MKKAFIFTFLLLCFYKMPAQNTDETLREYFLDAEFFLEQEAYVDALYDYLEVYKKGFEDNANINYRIGICYLNIPGQKDKSIPYLVKAIQNITAKYKEGVLRETKAPIDAVLYLGNAYRINNQLDKAIDTYSKYKALAEDNDKKGVEFADKQIEACQIAKEFMENPVQFEKTNLGPIINNSSSNFKAVVSGDGNTILYMNELPFYNAVYYSKKVNNEWSEPVNITPEIQSDGNQYVCSVSFDGTQLYLSREDNFDSDIYFSKLVEGRWTKSVPLDNNINTKYWESHASISRDGKTLYFTSNRKGGVGEMDIYKSELDDKGQWGEAINLGNNINTILNEDTPFITENGKSLYFSSQAHKGMGGYDIFVSHLDSAGVWSTPENLGYPINTTDDDLFFYPWDNGKYAYMALFSKEGYGKEDIYRLKLVPEEVIEESIAEAIAEDVDEEEALQNVDTIDTIEKAVEQPEKVKVQVFELRPVYFGFDTYKLNAEGIKELNRIASMMSENTNLELEISGYTDALGPDDYNQGLSEKRAMSVLNYLVKKGINKSRMKANGYGESHPAAINKNPDGTDNPEGRKYNRRVEFDVTGADKNKIIFQKAAVPDELKVNKH